MKNFMITTLFFIGMTGFSFGGNCANGFCNRPSGRIVAAPKTITKEVVKVPRRIVSGCVNGKCNSKSVVKVK
jgi:hypothetical protein